MSWTIEFYEDFDREFQGFDDRVQDKILAKMIALQKEGPNLDRPHADTLNGSVHSNMKELRFSAAGHLAHRLCFGPQAQRDLSGGRRQAWRQ